MISQLVSSCLLAGGAMIQQNVNLIIIISSRGLKLIANENLTV